MTARVRLCDGDDMTTDLPQLPQKYSVREQYRKCGKDYCLTCKKGPGHGPYLYASWREGGKVKHKYLGPAKGRKFPIQPENIEQLAITVPAKPVTELDAEHLAQTWTGFLREARAACGKPDVTKVYRPEGDDPADDARREVGRELFRHLAGALKANEVTPEEWASFYRVAVRDGLQRKGR